MHKFFETEERLPGEEAQRLRDKAAQCRRMAIGIADHQTAAALRALADEYERDAAVPPRAAGPPPGTVR